MLWRQIIIGLICLVVAAGTGFLLYSNTYSGIPAVVIFVVGLFPLLLFLFSGRIGSYLSTGDSISLSAGPFSIEYSKPVEKQESGSTISNTRTNYDLFLTIIRSNSPELENKLRMQRPDDVDESIDYIVTVLKRGLSDPLAETTSILHENLEMYDFLQTTTEGFSQVEDFTADDEMRVEMDTEYGVIEEGTRFGLYIDWTVSTRGEERSFRKKVADAEIIEIESDNWCLLRVSNWDIDNDERNGDIMDRNPCVKIDQSTTRTVPKPGLQRAHSYLDEIPNNE